MLVGPPASGKTTLRGRLVARGLPPAQVVSLDDLRRELARDVEARGGPARPLQAWTVVALRRAAAQSEVLLADGVGYLADATHLRRRERVLHVHAAHRAGLPVVAVLLPGLPAEVLLARDARRPEPDRVPEDVLLRHVHRRSLLSPGLLRAEGFDAVVDADAAGATVPVDALADAVEGAVRELTGPPGRPTVDADAARPRCSVTTPSPAARAAGRPSA